MPNPIESLRTATEEHPGRSAIRMGATALSYADLWTRAARFGHRLRNHGVDPGDRVAIATAPVARYAVAYYGTLFAGAVAVPLNPAQPEPVLAARLRDARPRTLVVTHGPPTALRAAAAAAAVSFTDLDAPGTTGRVDPHPVHGADPAAIYYKSADGDEPTGVVLSHDNLGWSAAAAAGVLSLAGDDTLACWFPLFHPLGQTYGLGAAISAGSTLALPVSRGASPSVPTLQTSGATVLVTFPALVGGLGRTPVRQPAGEATLRTVLLAGGAVLEPRVRRRLESSLGCEVLEGHGTFESSALACATPPGTAPRPGSVGVAVPGVELAVVDTRGREAASGKAGQLLMRGPNVTVGYWDRPQETARAFSNGWLLTGDRARRDSDGHVYLLDGVLWTDPLRGRHGGRQSLLRRGLSKLGR